MYENKKVTKAQIAKLKRQHEARTAAHEKAKAELSAFISGWCAEKHGNLKKLANAAGVSTQAMHGYVSGKQRRAGIVKLIELAEIINTISV